VHGTTHAGAVSPRKPASYAAKRRAAGSPEFLAEAPVMSTQIHFQVRCAVCEHDVPLSEAVVPEASDYMAYFCGLDCYQRWRAQAARFLAPSTQ
jgi:Domain of unknown function (DUF3330)